MQEVNYQDILGFYVKMAYYNYSVKMLKSDVGGIFNDLFFYQKCFYLKKFNKNARAYEKKYFKKN